MNQKELAEKVDKIIASGNDPEMAHAREDDLHLALIETFCPKWAIKEVARLADADFPRWCA